MKFTVYYSKECPCVDIETDTIKEKDSFSYGNILGMYKTKNTQGHGLQSNNSKNHNSLMKMCDKIAQAVYDYQNETEEN